MQHIQKSKKGGILVGMFEKTRISVTVSASVNDELERFCRKYNLPKSQVIGVLLAKQFEEMNILPKADAKA